MSPTKKTTCGRVNRAVISLVPRLTFFDVAFGLVIGDTLVRRHLPPSRVGQHVATGIATDALQPPSSSIHSPGRVDQHNAIGMDAV